MRIALHRDCMGWAGLIAAAARERGHEISESIEGADAAFARLVTFHPWRTRGLDFLKEAIRLGVPTLPEPQNVGWYDDKVAQLPLLTRWLPQTIVVRQGDPLPDAPGGYPFISKASTGAASRNVRLVRNEAHAKREYHAALHGAGIPTKPEGMQRGYLYWQRFLPGNAGDIRVVVIGDEAFGIWRGNRDDAPFASGSGRIAVIVEIADARVAAAFRMADEISTALGTRWQAYDFVFDGDRCYCLEATCSWNHEGYVGCPMFDRKTLNATGKTQDDWPARAVIEMERLCSP